MFDKKHKHEEKLPDHNPLSKIFVDGMIGAHAKYIFSFSMVSGDKLVTFATVPQIFKVMTKWMNEQVESYEEKFGEISLEVENHG